MSKRLPMRWFVGLLVAALVAAAAFLLLNRAFGGPGGRVGASGYELHTKLADSQQLLTKSLVLVRGVKVGEVTRVEPSRSGTEITFTVDDRYDGVGAGASAAVGWRTAFGEAYLKLDRGRSGGPRLDSGSRIPGRASVETDEALTVFDGQTRTHAQGVIQELGAALEDPARAGQIRTSISGLAGTAGSLRTLTESLEGQGDDLAGLVTDSAAVASTLAGRERSLRTIVDAGTDTMQATAAGGDSLRAGIRELPRLSASADSTLRELPSVLEPANAVSDDVAAAVRELRPALQQSGPALASANSLASRAPKLASAAVPVLQQATPVVKGLEPAAKQLEPTLRNMIPLAQWLQPRAGGYASVFANLSSATQYADSDGKWLRVFLINDEYVTNGREATVTCGTGARGGACFNPYPEPDDAINPKPYTAGSHPRLTPYPKP